MKPLRAITTAALALSCATQVCAVDWPQWRGPDFNGSARGLAAAVSTGEVGAEIVWRRPLGSGYSSISISGDLAVTMASFDGGDHVLAIDAATGDEVWSFRVADAYLGRAGSDDGPSSTPAIDGAAAYALTPSGHVVAIELATGELRWRRHLETDFRAEPHTYGYSTAPIVSADTLFLLGGPTQDAAVLALDTASGELRWSAGAGSVEHHNPAVVSLAGVEQVIAPTSRAVAGYAVDDGTELWRHPFDSGSHSGDVTPLDDAHLLITRWDGNTLLKLHPDPAGLRSEVVWTTKDLERTYAVPVHRAGYLYGFDSRFLTCVSLETGERVWRSRPPGGSGLILVDGLLATVSSAGELVLAAASPQGYREHIRLPLFEPRRVMTPPSVAGGAMYVRNLEEVVALRPAKTVAGDRSGHDDEDPWIAALRSEISGAQDPAAAVESMLAALPDQPVLRGNRTYFFYLGDHEDLVITGDMTGGFAEVPMRRMPGTDLYYRAFDAPDGGARWEYVFKSFEETHLDPLNPREVATPEGPRSVAEWGAAAGTPFAECDSCPAGRLETLRIGDSDSEEGHGATVYLPPGYDAAPERSFPLVIWFLGSDALEFGRIPQVLDSWSASRGRSVIAAFLDLPQGLMWQPQRQAFASVMSDEVLPALEEKFRISAEPGDRALVVQQWAAENGLPWVLGEPRMAKLGAQSPMLGGHYVTRTLAPLAEADAKLSVYIDWGRYDGKNLDEGLDVAALAAALAGVLERAGHTIHAVETPGGSNWTRWRQTTPTLLDTLFPTPSETPSE